MELGILAEPAIGNLFLLVAAVIGVGGSWGLYFYRRKKTRETIRRSILKELESMEFSDQLEEAGGASDLPYSGVLVTKTYEQNSSDVGMLSSEEVESIVSFYSDAITLKTLFKSRRKLWIESKIDATGVKRGASELNKELHMELEKLGGKRLRAIHTLRKHLNEDYIDPSLFELPDEGERISSAHPIIRRYEESLLDDNCIQPTDNEDVYQAIEDLTGFYEVQSHWIARQITG